MLFAGLRIDRFEDLFHRFLVAEFYEQYTNQGVGVSSTMVGCQGLD